MYSNNVLYVYSRPDITLEISNCFPSSFSKDKVAAVYSKIKRVKVRQEVPWVIMFADDIVIFVKSTKMVGKKNLN